MKYIQIIMAAFLITTGITGTAHAQPSPVNQGSNPIEVTAENHLEWRRGEKLFIAKGNAKAIQADTSIEADTLRANYTEGANKKGLEINEFGANGTVILTSADNKAYGDYATYNIPKSYAEMTGSNLRLTSPSQTLTATDRFEYWVDDGRLIATGNVKVTRPKPDGSGTDTIQSAEMIATLRTINGKRAVDTLEAKDNVIITTPTEKITGAYAIYKKTSNRIEMKGNVINTNISKIFGGNTPTNRVRGVFYPGSDKKDTQGQQFAPQPKTLQPSQPQKTIEAKPIPLQPTQTTPTPQPFKSPEELQQQNTKPQIEILLPPQEQAP